MENNSKIKKMKTISGVLAIGILGTALWELLIRDVLFFIGNLLISTFSLFYKGYVNDMYSKIESSDYIFQILPSLMIVTFILIFPFYFLSFLTRSHYRHKKFSNKEQKEENQEEEQQEDNHLPIGLKSLIYILQKKSRIYIFWFLTCIPIFLIYSDLLIKEVSGSTAYRVINRNLIIIKPYVDEKEYDKLQSEFRLSDNKDKLIKVIIKINNIAEKNKVDLGESKLLALGVVKNIK